MKILSFGSRRTDYNEVKTFQDGNKELTPPRIRLLKGALHRLANEGSKRNVDYLFNIAQNNKYGLRANSALRKYIEENSVLANGVLENNDWDKEIKEIISQAVAKLPKSKREEYEQQVNKLFIEPQKLAPQEKRLIKYREFILNSKEMKNAIDDANKKGMAESAVKNLDYFIASSEVPISTRVYVLSKLAYLLSDKYKIDPQLKDEKVRIFSEMINDLVIKTPENDLFNTKKCSQEQHGSCAAISLGRKMLVYEDKKAYVDTILNEVSDKPYMEVYDVTRLLEYSDDPEKLNKLRAPKIKVEKAYVDYKRALKEGYRVIDASILNWMKIAGTIGDGTINLEDYCTFDAENYGFMHDSRMIKSFDSSYIEDHNLLRVLIKAKNLLESYDKKLLYNKIAERDFARNGMELARKRDITRQNVKSIILEVVPQIETEKISSLLFKMLRDKNINVKNNDNVLAEQLFSFLSKELGEQYEPEIKTRLASLVKCFRDYVDANDNYLQVKYTKEKEIAHAKRLFKLGVAQRAIVKQVARMHKKTDYLYGNLGLPDRITQIHNHVRRLRTLLKDKPNSSYIVEFKKLNGLDNKAASKMLADMDKQMAVQIPKEIDNILSVFNFNTKKLVIKILQSSINDIKAGQYDYLYDVEAQTGKTYSVEKFEAKLNEILAKVRVAKSNKQVVDAMSELGVFNYISAAKDFISYLFEQFLECSRNGNYAQAKNIITKKFQPKNELEVIELMKKIALLFGYLDNSVESIAKTINYPNDFEVIVSESERRGDILSEAALNNLRDKFDLIAMFSRDEKQAKEKTGLKKSDVFVFSKEQKRWLSSIENNIPMFKRDVNRDYRTLNMELKDHLSELYEDLGKRKGFFWVSEEGSTGLYSNESIRLIEQMTGRPHYSEKDIDMVVDYIKSGKGSGTSGTMVSYNEYSGHAQYIADVKPVKYKDEKTGEIIEEDVILHDNTWGNREEKTKFIDKNGLSRTDYKAKYGGPEGFITEASGLAGQFVKNVKWDHGINTELKYKAVEGPLLEINEEQDAYPIIDGVKIQGIDPKTSTKINKIFAKVFNFEKIEPQIDNLFSIIEKTNGQVNANKLIKLDERLETELVFCLNRIGGNGKPPMSLEDYDKLPESDPLKLIINKLIIKKAYKFMSDELQYNLGEARTPNGLEKVKRQLLDEVKEVFADVCGKNLNLYKTELKSSLNSNIKNNIIRIEDEYNVGLKDLKKNLLIAVSRLLNSYNGSVKDFLNKYDLEVAKIIANDSIMAHVPLAEHIKLRKNIKENFSSMIYNFLKNKIYFMPESKYFINWIDEKYNPFNDQEFLKIHSKLIDMPEEQFNKVISSVTQENIGIKLDKPENVIKLIQAGNRLEIKRLEEICRYHWFSVYAPIRVSKNKITPVSNDLAKFNNLYRNIDIELSTIGGDKFLKEEKEPAFLQYKARPAIPRVQVKSDNELAMNLNDLFDDISDKILGIKKHKLMQKYIALINAINLIIKSDKIEENKQVFLNNLKTLSKMSDRDLDFPEIRVAAEKIMKKLNNKNFAVSNITKEIDVINSEALKVFGGLDESSINRLVERDKKVLKKLKTVVESNVLPRHQAQAHYLMNQWIKALVEDSESEKTKYAKNEMIEKMVQCHLLKEPRDLLKYAVELAQKNVLQGANEEKTEIIENLKKYLVLAYKKANHSNLEYELMRAASIGVASKFKDFIEKQKNVLVVKNGQTFPVISDEGIEYIINNLGDAESNNSTLMLFLEQCGLVDMALNYLYKVKPSDYKSTVEQLFNNIKMHHESQNIINTLFDKFSQSIPKDAKVSSSEDLKETKDKFINLIKSSVDDKLLFQEVADFYAQYFSMIIENVKILDEKPSLYNLFTAVHINANEAVTKSLFHWCEEYNNYLKFIQTRITLLKEIKLAKGSEDDIKRNKQIEMLEQIEDFAVACCKSIGVDYEEY